MKKYVKRKIVCQEIRRYVRMSECLPSGCAEKNNPYIPSPFVPALLYLEMLTVPSSSNS